MPPIDLNSLPDDASTLRKIVGELAAQLQHESAEKDKYRSLLRELLEAQRNRKSEQLSKEQLALFEELWKAQQAEDESEETEPDSGGDAEAQTPRTKKVSVRKPLPSHLVRERIVHDLAESEKRCRDCGKDLRLIGEDKSERYEYIPATMKVIEDVRLRYACDCTVKAAEKPPQPIEKSTAGASLLAQVAVSKFCDHQPLHRQEQMFARHGVEISRQTMCGWMASVAGLAMPLYETAKKLLFDSKVIGTDDTGVKVLDPKLDFARTGRIWPYVGDAHHPVVLFDYTPTRGLESDEQHMGPALHLIGRLYAVEDRAREFTAGERLALRQRLSAPVMKKLGGYLERIRAELLPKSPGARAVRYALNQWDALTRFLQDGDLEIDNGASERANRGVAVGRGNWTFFGSDRGGQTAAVLLSFMATCKRCGVEPFAWFRDVLTRLATHPVTRLAELLPHNWKTLVTSQA